MMMAVAKNPPALVTEYCSNGSLYNCLHQQRRRLTLAQLLSYARDMAAGLTYLHAQRIIHRDVKSPNMLISKHNTIKVADFGFTRSKASGVWLLLMCR